MAEGQEPSSDARGEEGARGELHLSEGAAEQSTAQFWNATVQLSYEALLSLESSSAAAALDEPLGSQNPGIS